MRPFNNSTRKIKIFMNTSEQSWCLEVMEKLMRYPCAKPFIDPVDDKEEGFENYYKKIKDPIDLGQIQAKLLTNEYTGFSEVKHDISIIVKNTERFWSRNDIRTAMAREMQERFLSIIKHKEMKDPKNWIVEILELQEKVERIVHDAPQAVKSHCKTMITALPLPVMTAAEIKKLVEASEQLKEKKDAQNMLQIILDVHPYMAITSKDMIVNIDSLENTALWLLHDYINKRFDDLGLEYPE
ncbi:Bromodomain containing protein [Tritrichomonas foetus]|uniref:Bromodomain containing protein n=1 Tax=Tritrichomonas foetus TaxID=1144522 RepID=A0A1J4J5U5_9EUKA|nr:Bromodomain containing protein [Tritrichomonas foetus]|eukprot:OHS93519.1 Bromodomain containing protein [Tritrichomonas foetus]